ncbi:MAG: peptidoglycan-binding protein [Prochlorotrichaceae cyanobacterium]|jgi:N-acetylmuramoyl-L-alanine amidase
MICSVGYLQRLVDGLKPQGAAVHPRIASRLRPRVLHSVLGLGLFINILLGSTVPIAAQSSVARVRSTLSLGSQGTEVVELQSILQFLGFYLGRVDGVFSESTQQGVQRFQQAAGLPITGQMTLVEWNRLLPSAGGQPSQATANPVAVSAAGTTPPPSAESFPIPETASQPPTGSIAPPNPDTAAPPPNANGEPPAASEESTAATASEPTSVTFPLLRRSSRGRAVEQLQQRLSALGFYSGTIDGIFGEETESAVQDFQAEFDLETDGIVGSATWQTLFNTP